MRYSKEHKQETHARIVKKASVRLREKGAALHIMDPAMDTSTPAGRLTFNVLASIAQFEREIMRATIAAPTTTRSYLRHKAKCRCCKVASAASG